MSKEFKEWLNSLPYSPTPEEAWDAGRAALAAAPVQAGKWEGAEEWMPLAWELCANENGEEACMELVWEGGPIPEPWGERWLKYEDQAKEMIAMVRKHVPALAPAAPQVPTLQNGLTEAETEQTASVAGLMAPQVPAVPDGPFLVRDVAEILGVSVPDVCRVLIALGHSQRSTNMTITPDEGIAVAKWLRAAQPAEPAPLTDEQIQDTVTAAVKSGRLSWLGFEKDELGAYTVPILSPWHFQFARAIEAAHGIRAAGVKEPGNASN